MGYLGTKPNVATSLADNIVTADKISDGVVGTNDLSNGAVTAAKITSGAISNTTVRSNSYSVKFSSGNSTPGQPVNTAFTLSEAEAPIGSYVVMGVRLTSGNSSGDQYCYLFQRDLNSSRASIQCFVEGWFWETSNMALFYINDASDRTFHVSHGTIVATNANDSREVRYYGHIRITQ
jgi:hypothetical protein